MYSKYLCFLFLWLVTTTSTIHATPQLVQVQVIARHGARVALGKSTAQGVYETTKVVLTPYGETQMYDLGTWLRNRYAIADSLLENEYVSHEVHFESSRLERTISSANLLATGLYPSETRRSETTLLPSDVSPGIPIYTYDDQNDVYMQAYDKCPSYDASLQKLYASDDWKQMATDNRGLLNRLAKVPLFQPFTTDDGKFPLNNLWMAFDMIQMAKKECALQTDSSNVYCQFNPLDDTSWEQLQSSTTKVEIQRYSSVVASDLLGANLLFLIHERMGGDMTQLEEGIPDGFESGFRKFHFYSAHYQTLLSLFAALNIDPPTNEVIPGFGAAFIFELYNDPTTGVYFIYMLYKQAYSNNVMSIQFPDGPCEGDDSCPLSSFTKLLATFSYTSLSGWCSACANVHANVCMELLLHSPDTPSTRPASLTTKNPSQTPEPNVSPSSTLTTATTTCSNTIGTSVIVVYMVAAFLGGMTIGMILLIICRKRRMWKRQEEKVADLVDPDDLINMDYSDRIT